MQVTIARQLGLDPSTVSNFFMNARRRSIDKWKDDSVPTSTTSINGDDDCDYFFDDASDSSSSPLPSDSAGFHDDLKNQENSILVSTSPAAIVQHISQDLSTQPKSFGNLDL